LKVTPEIMLLIIGAITLATFVFGVLVLAGVIRIG
jgi:hypothetical protein